MGEEEQDDPPCSLNFDLGYGPRRADLRAPASPYRSRRAASVAAFSLRTRSSYSRASFSGSVTPLRASAQASWRSRSRARSWCASRASA